MDPTTVIESTARVTGGGQDESRERASLMEKNVTQQKSGRVGMDADHLSCKSDNGCKGEGEVVEM